MTCKDCGRTNCANPGWPSWGYLQCRDVAYDREKSRVGTLEKANEMIEEERKREKARADQEAREREMAVSACVDWSERWDAREAALAAARRECEGLRMALRKIDPLPVHVLDEAHAGRQSVDWARVVKWVQQEARAALAAPVAGEEGKHG